jgi:hypothetical protein
VPCDPSQHLPGPKAPVFAEAIGGEAVCAAFAKVPIYPGHGNLEKACDFLNGQELIVNRIVTLAFH